MLILELVLLTCGTHFDSLMSNYCLLATHDFKGDKFIYSYIKLWIFIIYYLKSKNYLWHFFGLNINLRTTSNIYKCSICVMWSFIIYYIQVNSCEIYLLKNIEWDALKLYTCINFVFGNIINAHYFLILILIL